MENSTRGLKYPFIKRLFLGVLYIAAFGATVYFVGSGLIGKYIRLTSVQDKNYVVQTYQDIFGNECNVAMVRLENSELWANDVAQASSGSNGYGADVITAQIEQAKNDPQIKGLLLQIDSPGGSPTGGEMISKALKRLGKPSVALIFDQGDSAAYFAATGASTIIASPFSSVGDIGVTSSFVDYSGSNAKEGNTFEQISSGKYKDAGNPDKALTGEERDLLKKNVDIEYNTLVNQIAFNRHMTTSTVLALADGSDVPGSEAITKGLIDQLGDLSTAKDWLTHELKVDVVLCDPDL